MNEFKGTPGPWTVREIEGAFHNQKAYAIDFNEDQEQVVDYVYRKEDANLIAAAPDLLSDLIEAAQLLRNYEKLHREKGTEDGLIKAARNKAWAEQFEATITKATSDSN